MELASYDFVPVDVEKKLSEKFKPTGEPDDE